MKPSATVAVAAVGGRTKYVVLTKMVIFTAIRIIVSQWLTRQRGRATTGRFAMNGTWQLRSVYSSRSCHSHSLEKRTSLVGDVDDI